MERRSGSFVRGLAIVLATIGFASTASAATVAIPGLFNTGLDLSGNVLGLGGIDAHYTITTRPASTSDDAATLRNNTTYPLTAYAWKDEGASAVSAWVYANNDFTPTGQKRSPPGTYYFTTTFDLTGFVLSSVAISGKWMSDNDAQIWLNGNNTGYSTGFQDFDDAPGYFTFSLLNSLLNPGANTLEFRVSNGTSGNSPVSLRVEMNGTASPVPLPAAAWLLLSGIAGLGLVARRRTAI